jgi:hypothetical protein
VTISYESIIENQRRCDYLNNYFDIRGSGATHGSASFDANGKVNVDGSITARSSNNGKTYLEFGKVSENCLFGLTELTTLVGSPTFVGNYFDCTGNHLSDLVGGPITVGSYRCVGNKLTSIDGFPDEVKCMFTMSLYKDIPFPSLRLISLKCEQLCIYASWCRDRCERILDDYKYQFDTGQLTLKEAMWKCQKELIDDGFDHLAKM